MKFTSKFTFFSNAFEQIFQPKYDITYTLSVTLTLSIMIINFQYGCYLKSSATLIFIKKIMKETIGFN